MDAATAFSILLAHYVGDWVLQVFFHRWMGKKNEDWIHLLRHATVLLIPLAIVGALFGDAAGVYWAGLNAAAHFLIDAVTSRLTHKFYSMGSVVLTDVEGRRFTATIQAKSLAFFWFTIGTDQFLHLVLLFWTWEALV